MRHDTAKKAVALRNGHPADARGFPGSRENPTPPLEIRESVQELTNCPLMDVRNLAPRTLT